MDWQKIRHEYEAGTQSIRRLAEKHHISDTAIRKRAKKEKWGRPGGAKGTGREPREPTRNLPALPDSIVKAASAPLSLSKRGKAIVERLLDELDAMTSGLGELEDMIFDDTRDDKDSRRRNAMLRAISHHTRTQAAKNLALALRTYEETGPGKKEAAQEAAKTAGGEGTGWGDDLNVMATRPN